MQTSLEMQGSLDKNMESGHFLVSEEFTYLEHVRYDFGDGDVKEFWLVPAIALGGCL